MKHTLRILLSLMISSFSYAGIETDYPEVKSAIIELGINLDDFSTFWPHYCQEKWSKSVPKNSYRSIEFISSAIDKKYFDYKINGDFVDLKPGKKCKALNSYYLHGTNEGIINQFISKDKEIKEKYGFSAIDLYLYPHNFQGNYTTRDKSQSEKEFLLQIIKRFKVQEIFNIEETVKTKGYEKVNGAFKEAEVTPHSVFHVSPTAKFIAAHKKLVQQ